jgi:hypothetical protein
MTLKGVFCLHMMPVSSLCMQWQQFYSLYSGNQNKNQVNSAFLFTIMALSRSDLFHGFQTAHWVFSKSSSAGVNGDWNVEAWAMISMEYTQYNIIIIINVVVYIIIIIIVLFLLILALLLLILSSLL